MNTGGLAAAPQRDSYDVVIVGGAIISALEIEHALVGQVDEKYKWPMAH